MMYKVTLKDGGRVTTEYMDGKTLESLSTDKIVDVEKFSPPEISGKESWDYENKVL